jgi:hypothetical protein
MFEFTLSISQPGWLIETSKCVAIYCPIPSPPVPQKSQIQNLYREGRYLVLYEARRFLFCNFISLDKYKFIILMVRKLLWSRLAREGWFLALPGAVRD